LVARRVRVIYLPGVAGYPGPSPAFEQLDVEVVVPELPGFDGRAGFRPPPDYVGWLTVLWDALDATGALPCPVVGASLGGMLAADVAALRPEAVTRLALLAPFGIFDASHPTTDLFAMGAPTRLETLFAGDVPSPFTDLFADRGPEEQLMAQHVVSVAAASLLWPLGDQHLASRVHRVGVRSMLVWGADDAVVPVAVAEHWPLDETVVVPDAGHMVEWDAPDAVAEVLAAFLGATRTRR
jgi:pimeloyl-ACP methyl ester carboxylesterase